MAEHVIVRQDSAFQARFWFEREDGNQGGKMEEVQGVQQLNPYSMMLASLGSCTTIVLHTYAQHHQIKLKEVEIRLDYQRNYREDCETCENQGGYSEEINEDILLRGELNIADRQKLLTIAHACPIYRMFREGIPIHSQLVEES